MAAQTLLITGVSSGTGLGLAERFLAAGYRVVGSVRTPEQAATLQARLGDRFVPAVFDVTVPEQIRSAAERLREESGLEHLAAIVNNAGSAQIGPLLHVAPDEFRAQLDVLVVGQLAVIQAFFGFLLADDAGAKAGRIFNISSISGTGANYLFGCYAAGKHALEGLSKTLRKECSMYGVEVVTVAPGNIATAIWDKQTDALIERYRDTDYYPALQGRLRDIEADVVKRAMTVEEFADAFFGIFTEPDPAERYTVIKQRNKNVPFSKEKLRILRA